MVCICKILIIIVSFKEECKLTVYFINKKSFRVEYENSFCFYSSHHTLILLLDYDLIFIWLYLHHCLIDCRKEFMIVVQNQNYRLKKLNFMSMLID